MCSRYPPGRQHLGQQRGRPHRAARGVPQRPGGRRELPPPPRRLPPHQGLPRRQPAHRRHRAQGRGRHSDAGQHRRGHPLATGQSGHGALQVRSFCLLYVFLVFLNILMDVGQSGWVVIYPASTPQLV